MPIPKEINDGIVIKKDGLYRYYWNDGQQITKVDSLLDWLREPLYFGDDITFEDFFNYVMNECDRANDIFRSHLGGFPLKNWLDEWNKPDPGDKKYADHEEINYVEMYWAAEFHGKNPEFGVEEWLGFHGVGRIIDKNAYGDEEWHDTNFGFSFTPLNEYKHYSFNLDYTWKLYDWDSNPKDEKTWYVYEGRKAMTVYDVIGGLLFDISFYGSPNERQEKADELEEQVQRIKDGKEELIFYDSVEEMMEDLKKDDESD